MSKLKALHIENSVVEALYQHPVPSLKPVLFVTLYQFPYLTFASLPDMLCQFSISFKFARIADRLLNIVFRNFT